MAANPRPGTRAGGGIVQRLCRVVSLLSPLFDVAVYEREDLERGIAAPTFTAGLDDDRAIYLGSRPLPNPGLAEGPGLYGPLAEWRPLRGRQLPPAPDYDSQHRRIAAWLNLQSWWRFSFRAALRPAAPRTPYMAVKFVSEPVPGFVRREGPRQLCWLEPLVEPGAFPDAAALHAHLGEVVGRVLFARPEQASLQIRLLVGGPYPPRTG